MRSVMKWFLAALAFFIFTLTLLCFTIPKRNSYETYSELYKKEMGGDDELLMVPYIYNNYSHGKWRLLSKDQQRKLSRLGRILFLGEKSLKLNPPTKNYSILIWNYDLYLKSRPHMKRSNPLENCSVKNCLVTGNARLFLSANIIIFDLRTTKSLHLLNKSRKTSQIWAFLTDQSPLNTIISPQRRYLRNNHRDLFNWSMSYRMDSDIPIPYGRTVVLKVGEKGRIQKYSQWNKNKKQDVLLAIVSSDCVGQNHRWNYIRKLQKYLKIDIYGKCGNNTCQSDHSNTTTNFTNDCAEISNYKFYLAFENSNCDEYITEKVWWYGYAKNTIPIVMGGSKASYEQILPPYSYINVDNFASPRDLANYINYLNHTPSDIQDYFTWKRYYKVLNEHGHFHTETVHYCRICEALNYNSRKKKVYEYLSTFWNTNKCYPSWDTT